MKKFLIILLLIICLIPMNVKANILCKDGTTSPTCKDCHSGCCSHHGGCASSSKSYTYTNQKQTNKKYDTYEEYDDNAQSGIIGLLAAGSAIGVIRYGLSGLKENKK